ncbi:DNA polymerase zeta catalytic subunit, putative [Trypanosoma brucei brucei TREU927]|uniref:DNA polymerase n=1 Tax=Trypanosoma brucei brucei (strain 927/4 GUTat10.1) TaxID=185431 RepID=Q57YY4_TRYB2|nr:DNA polymerase zeta catalytic subunit, putative [Trypanosoma brucei brucei TREU927]AAX79648.1 DNA polymerase zeta catalytic subunit, putative [Trypanosoma brucei]AAZ13094.1 DNA polymerase zeta catalytic subunit, putative [Trypanosoma brucei brucei TREU927]
MNLYVVSIEYTLQRPNAALGDAVMSPMFRRVSSRCPILHIFGYTTTEGNDRAAGEKSYVPREAAISESKLDSIQRYSVCAHIHGVYPYFFVQRSNSRISAMQFGTQLESVAMEALSSGHNKSAAAPRPHDRQQLIHHVDVVWLLPFYGYHGKKQPFFKVYVVDPAMVSRFLHLLYCTKHMGGRQWLVYEAHSPFHFQFMADYGAKGMGAFFIPSCTARSKLPDSVQPEQLNIAAVRPEGEPARLSCAQIEVDVSASSLRFRDGAVQPGENLLTARRNVRQYFADLGVDDAVLRGCTSGLLARRFTVSDQQRCDLGAVLLRKRFNESLKAKFTDPVVEEQEKVDSPVGVTQQLMEDMQGIVGEVLLPDSSPGCFSAPQHSLHNDQGEVGTSQDPLVPPGVTSEQGGCDERERPLPRCRSSDTPLPGNDYVEGMSPRGEDEPSVLFPSTLSSDGPGSSSNTNACGCSVESSKGGNEVALDARLRNDCGDSDRNWRESLSVGDTVAIASEESHDTTTAKSCLFAKIVCLGTSSVRLRWYVALSETHLADCQDELEKRGCWLGKGTKLGGCTPVAQGYQEELLLGDVEDINSISVLRQGPPIVVHHSYHSFIHDRNCGKIIGDGDCFISIALLCRYNYHVRERRLSAIEPRGDDNYVAMPALLLQSTPCASSDDESSLLAEVADEDEELFSSLSLSPPPDGCELCTFPHQRAPSRPSGSDHRVSGNNFKLPEGLRRSVSKTMQCAVQSQLSLLQSFSVCCSLSPRIREPVSPSVVAISSGVTRPSCALSSSSVECVDPQREALLVEFKREGSCVRCSNLIGDIPRNFIWRFDPIQRRVVISGATWPRVVALAPKLPPPTKCVSSLLKRPSVQLLTRIAHSQDLTPPEGAHTVAAKQEWCPHGSSSGSRSQRHSTRLICALRVMLVEVFLHRRDGVQHVAQERLLAVGLGRTTSIDERVKVRLFCVTGLSQKVPVGQPRVSPFSGAVEVVQLPSEEHLLRHVMWEIRAYDPDVIISWEVGRSGIGLLALRYKIALRRSLARDLSRLTPDSALFNQRSENIHLNPEEKPSNSSDENISEVECVSPSSDSSHSSCSESTLFSTGSGATAATTRGSVAHVRGGSTNAHPNLGDLTKQLSRRFGGSPQVAGRIIVDLSKYLRKYLQLPSTTLQMVYKKLFNSSLPFFTDVALTRMYCAGEAGMQRVFMSILLTRVVAPHRIAQHLHFFTRTAEFARMFGILFSEVLTRGSQYRVEATLHRMAKPMGFALLSPPLEVVHRQPRLQSMPLIMQPRSGFYKDDPVVVLDFRSLYPSIVIAYNICYTTCLGSVGKGVYGRLGVLKSYKRDDMLLSSLLSGLADTKNDHNGKNDDNENSNTLHGVTFTPNGCMFLTPENREGVLPQMLRVLLDTRVDLQAALKHVAHPFGDIYMQQILQEQQMAIKMLANTTYGYTAASFTGRMPCADVADAIVMLGRQTLERAMWLINSHPVWKAEVVYGDTDSLFVRLPGRTKEEAFAVGEEMAKEVTAVNPAPVRLQFEKVLFPCLLLVKKRYVGYAYFKPEQQEPQFLAKGIETVRRDQCPATAHLAAKMIHLLFSGAGTETLRQCFYEEVSKLQRGDCSPVDCIFRKAVKFGRYKPNGRLPAAARLAALLVEKDAMRTPYWGERIPFVVIRRPESTRLSDRVVHPQQLLSDEDHLMLDSEYYITRHIVPTLDRMFYLVGVSCGRWYAEMPRGRTYQNYFELGLSIAATKAAKRARGVATPPTLCADVINVNISNANHGNERFKRKGRGKGKGGSGLLGNQSARGAKNRTLDSYYQQTLCAVCLTNSTATSPTDPPVCKGCLENLSTTAQRVTSRRYRVERHLQLMKMACLRCIGTCGEVGGPGFLSSRKRDMEDMNFCIPHSLAAAPDRGVHDAGVVVRRWGKRQQKLQGEEDIRCVSVDCHLSFEKKRLSSLYLQLLVLEDYVTTR